MRKKKAEHRLWQALGRSIAESPLDERMKYGLRKWAQANLWFRAVNGESMLCVMQIIAISVSAIRQAEHTARTEGIPLNDAYALFNRAPWVSVMESMLVSAGVGPNVAKEMVKEIQEQDDDDQDEKSQTDPDLH